MNEVDISALLQRIQAGDESALLSIYDRYVDAVYSVIYHILNHAQDAEEVSQDVFLRLWHKAETYDPARGRFLSWLLTIARRAAIDRLRQRDRREPYDIPLSIDEYPFLYETIASDDLTDLHRSLLSVLGELPDDQRDAIKLAYFYGMSHSDIAAHLEKPLGTIKSHIRLGMQKLRVIWLNQQSVFPESDNGSSRS